MSKKQSTQEKIGFVVKFLFGILIQIPFLFLPAWTLNWTEGWIWIGLFLLYVIFVTAYLYKHDMTLLKKRMSYKLPTEKWDRIIMYGFFITVAPIFILPGFDFRFSWSKVIWWVELIGGVCVGLAFFIIFLVMQHNSYLARIVEIRKEEGHKVITTGPYRVVRHPMYSAFLLLFISAPLLLGSYYALIPGILSDVLLIIRTLFEDKLLHTELEGYAEYAQKTRYRVIPGIW